MGVTSAGVGGAEATDVRPTKGEHEIIPHLMIRLLGLPQPSATNLRRFALAYRHARGRTSTSTSHGPLQLV